MFIKKILETPITLHEYSYCTDSDYIYIFGGYYYGDNNVIIHTNNTYKYDIKNSSLIKLSITDTLPEKRRGMNSIIYNNRMYIFGGQYGDGSGLNIRYNDVWYLDLRTLKWSKINTEIPGGLQHNSSLVINNDTVYIINLGWYSGQCWKYNILQNSWERLADIPDKLLYSGAVIYNNKIYVICGYHWTSNNDQYPVNKIFIYDILKNNWVTKNLPSDFKSRYYNGNGGFIFNNKLYFGFGDMGDFSEYDYLWYYDLQNNIFNKIKLIKTNTFDYKPIYTMLAIGNHVYCLSSSTTESTDIYKLYKLLFLIKQNSNYYSINNNYIDLGKIDNNEELDNLINNYGHDDLSIITKELNNKKIPTKLENDYYKSFDINLNDIKDSIDLIEENDKKYIEYSCNNYKISDEIKEINNGKFEVLMEE
ncbi:hypothetical protein G4W71_08240 [Clostridium botulinum]|uniref:Kelch repeat-containing protein n=1 Tax=Clostridium botulinum TaxID=1491 RepID=UPI0009AFACBE|nr:kelch repeat-containing protein [Clostridium botulinum]MBE1304016.1 hypothetical protein [Clostridium botulinum]